MAQAACFGRILAEESRADNAGIVSELSYTKLGKLVYNAAAVSLRSYDGQQTVDKALSLTRYTAAKGDYFGLENVDYGSDTGSEVLDVKVIYLLSRRVAGSHAVTSGSARYSGSVKHHAVSAGSAAFLYLFAGHADKSGSGGISLPTAASAAGAGCAVNVDNDVTELSTGMVEACVDLVVYNDTASNTCSEGDHNAVGSALSRACYCLTPSRRVCIVGDLDVGEVKLFTEESSEREHLEV